MAAQYSRDHFALLRKWNGKVYDNTNPEDAHAYDKLKIAYDITKEWAKQVQEKRFPSGRIKVVRKPTSQANKFDLYQWARIYPAEDSPNELAYTVGIDGNAGFVMKIDTVGLKENNPKRLSYLSLRGDFANSSPIVSLLPEADGLKKSLSELADWSVQCLEDFTLGYDQVAAKTSIVQKSEDGDPDLFQLFFRGSIFVKFRATLSDSDRRLFCSLARTVHEAGLDWWHINWKKLTRTTSLARFGRKEPGHEKATRVLGHVFIGADEHNAFDISLKFKIGDIDIDHRKAVDEQLVRRLAQGFEAGPDFSKTWKVSRRGCWPSESVSDQTVRPNDAALNRIYYGPPGTGKTFELNRLRKEKYTDEDEKRYTFVTFHQSYGYEEFVEGMRPVLDKGDSEVRYEVRAGAFQELCKRACKNPDRRFAMFIDEINRGNISKIFGELITLIESDKRDDGTDDSVTVTLPYSKKDFSVPTNVDIIGTMNTADRSLALLDTALRRRFEFVAVLPDARDVKDAPLYKLRINVDNKVVDIPRMLSTINRRIEVLYDRDHCIGHSYFLELRGDANGATKMKVLKKLFRRKVLPLLEEYFFEDWKKIRLVLGDHQKNDECQFVKEYGEHKDELKKLFGETDDWLEEDTRRIFKVQEAAFDNPNAYIGIYEPI